EIAGIHVDGRGQLTDEATGKLNHFIDRADADHETERAEDLFGKRVVGEELFAGNLEEVRQRLAAARLRREQWLHRIAAFKARLAVVIGLGDTVRQHGLRADLAERLDGG